MRHMIGVRPALQADQSMIRVYMKIKDVNAAKHHDREQLNLSFANASRMGLTRRRSKYPIAIYGDTVKAIIVYMQITTQMLTQEWM